MTYANSCLLEYKWSDRSSFFSLIVLSEIQLKIWWRMAINTGSKCFYISTNAVC